MALSPETATNLNQPAASDSGRQRQWSRVDGLIGVFDKLRVTSLSGMGACQFGITHPAVGEWQHFSITIQ
jgi:hypothetical protein